MPGCDASERGPECACRSVSVSCGSGLPSLQGTEVGHGEADGVFIRCRGKLLKSPGSLTAKDGHKVCRLEIAVDTWTLVAIALDGLVAMCAVFRRGKRVDVAGRLVVTPWRTGRGTQRETIRAEVTQASVLDG